MKLSLSEIIEKTSSMNSDGEKIEFLKKNSSEPLRMILKYTYDPEKIKFLIPSAPPPWKKNGYIDAGGMLYKEARRLRIFIQGGGYDTLNQVKREGLFISLLEDVDDKDAELLCKMILQKPIEGITKNVVMSAFPQDYS